MIRESVCDLCWSVMIQLGPNTIHERYGLDATMSHTDERWLHELRWSEELQWWADELWPQTMGEPPFNEELRTGLHLYYLLSSEPMVIVVNCDNEFR